MQPKEILKCPESILGYPRVLHLNDQEDKAIGSIAFFFWTSDDGKCTCPLPSAKHFHSQEFSGSAPMMGCGVGGGPLATPGVLSGMTLPGPQGHPIPSTARSIAEPDGHV